MARGLDAEWFWTDRWTRSRGFGLPMEARGLYREMLTQAWRRHARLPNNHEEIRRYTGCTLKEWNRAWPLIKKFWVEDGDGLVNPTQVVIYLEAQAAATRTSDRARAGAIAMHKRRVGDTQALPDAAPKAIAPVGRRYTRQDLKDARRILKLSFGRCPHEHEPTGVPKCVGAIECEVLIAIELADRRKRAS